MAGYSGKPLVQKLGIKPGFRIFAVGGAGRLQRHLRQILRDR
jgi:L-2-hydroxyglutarate oxidase LhgO